MRLKTLLKITICLICGFILIQPAFCQNYFYKSYSSDLTGQYNYGLYTYELPTGGFAVITNASSNGGFLLMTDSVGQLLTYRHYYGYAQYMRSILDDFMVLNDGNYLMVGDFRYAVSQSNRGIVKIDPQGNIIWAKSLGTGNTVSEDFLVKHKNGKQSLIVDNSSNYGFMISELDSGGNILNTTRVHDSLNRTINITNVSPLSDNGLLVAGNINHNEPVLLLFDSTYSDKHSKSYPGYKVFKDVVETKDKGFLCLFEDSTYQAFHIVKTDSTGTPLWSKSIIDSLKVLLPQLLYENEDKSIYCMVNWKDINSPLYNYSGAIIKLDSIGDLISITDSLYIQIFRDIKRTSNDKLYTLIARGSSNLNRPALLVTDSLFSSSTICMQHSNASSFTLSNSSTTFVNSVVQLFNYSHNIQTFSAFYTSGINNISSHCLVTGLSEEYVINNNEILINPNPSLGLFKINSPPGYMQIFNSIGQLMYFTEINSDEKHFDFSEFKNGVYFIVINTETGLISKKFIIHK